MSIRNRRGQGLIEYVILVALVAVATMSLVKVLQGTIKVNMARVIYALQGRGEAGERGRHQALKQSDVSKSDFSNFWKGSHNGGRGGQDAD